MKDSRDEWGSKMQFLLTCVGYSVGLGNVWRFPATAFNNGHGAFFIPYVICALVIGFPLMFFEMAIGQCKGISANRLFSKYVPVFRGLGWSMAVLNLLIGITYNTVIGWCLIYLFYSVSFMHDTSIWASCNNEWNKPCYCKEENQSRPLMECYIPDIESKTQSPSHEFFFEHIVHTGGFFNWRMAAAIFVSAFGCALLTIRGTKSIGKASYVTATVPYVLILTLLIRALFTESGLQGAAEFLSPDFSLLINPKTWYSAGQQVCYSLSLGSSNLIAFASCNKKNYNCFRDAMVVSLADFSMSLFGGLTIFSMLGHVDDGMTSQLEGTSLPFVIYPKALMLMPLPKLWASFFFLTLILLGVGSFGPIYLSGATMMIDQWPALGKYRPFLVLGQAVFYFVCGCLFCTEMGYDYFTVMNEYGPGFALLFVVFLELICCVHIYGYTNFRLDLMSMFGVPERLFSKIFSPSGLYLKYMWLIVSPLAIFSLFVFSLIGQIQWRNEPQGEISNMTNTGMTLANITITNITIGNMTIPIDSYKHLSSAVFRIIAWIFPLLTLLPLVLWAISVAFNSRSIDDLLIADENDSDIRRPSAYKIYTENATTIASGPPKPARTWSNSPSSPAHMEEENPAELDEDSQFQSAFVEPAISVPHRHIPFKSTLL